MPTYSWTCPFCSRPVTITDEDICEEETQLDIANAEGQRLVTTRFIVCPNPECKKFTLKVTIQDVGHYSSGLWYGQNILREWQLVPQSKAQSFPDYIPKAILDDYNEACLIKDLSPKASATLSRRCLQGIIRDFWGVKGDSLKDEIEQIKDKVEELTWQAIDAVRSVGNIGAHMEKDVNLIVDIEANEAELLVGLIETVLKDWYIGHHDRESRLKEIVKLGEDKESARKAKKDTT